MGIRIEHVRIKNFRSLRQVETTLGDVTLLLGANNSGKTSFLRALAIALNGDRKFISRDDLFIDGAGRSPAEPIISIDLMITPSAREGFAEEWALVFGEDIQLDAANQEFFAWRTNIDFSAQQTEARIRRFLIKDWASGDADEEQEVRAMLNRVPLFFIDAQRDLQEDLKYAQSYFGRLAAQIEYDEEQRTNLEQALDTLNEEAVRQSPVFGHLKSTLVELNKTVGARNRGVEITPFPKKLRDLHKGLKVHFQDGGSDSFSLEYHGMGTRSWASLLGYKAFIEWMCLEAERNRDVLYPILALEEPEAHLHPNAQRQAYAQLKAMSGQKIISTHSPYIAPLAGLSELRGFYKQKDVTEISDLRALDAQLKPKDRHNIETAIMRHRGELLFARAVVLFEGQTEEGALPVFARHYWGCEAFEKGVALLFCAGADYKPYLLLLEALRIPWVIFSDFDNPTVASKLKKAGAAIGVTEVDKDPRFIQIGQSIEAYLLEEGYRDQFVQAYFALKGPEYSDPIKRQQEEARIAGLDLAGLKEDKAIKEWKAKMGPLARAIVELPDESRRLPKKIKELLKQLTGY